MASSRTSRAVAATEWEQVVAAAKKEGKVAVNTFTGQGYARIFKLFSQAYPEIKLDHTNLESDAFAPRLVQERKAGIYTWDVTTIPTSTALQVMKQSGCGIRSTPSSPSPRRGATPAGVAASTPASSTATSSPTPSRWSARSACSSTPTR
jgi:hypothetical protein